MLVASGCELAATAVCIYVLAGKGQVISDLFYQEAKLSHGMKAPSIPLIKMSHGYLYL
jgi:hypothetical protein